MKYLSVILCATICLALTGCPKQPASNGNANTPTPRQTPAPDRSTRVVNAIAAIPGMVRLLFPNANPRTFEILDQASAGFREFVNHPNAVNFQHAMNLWNTVAKPELAKLNNTRLNLIAGVVDVLLTQISVPTGESIIAEPMKVEFKEEDVKQLENLVKR